MGISVAVVISERLLFVQVLCDRRSLLQFKICFLTILLIIWVFSLDQTSDPCYRPQKHLCNRKHPVHKTTIFGLQNSPPKAAIDRSTANQYREINPRRCSSFTINGICLLVLTNNALNPMASAFSSTAFEIMVSAGTCFPGRQHRIHYWKRWSLPDFCQYRGHHHKL